jgi:hypothetical protein
MSQPSLLEPVEQLNKILRLPLRPAAALPRITQVLRWRRQLEVVGVHAARVVARVPDERQRAHVVNAEVQRDGDAVRALVAALQLEAPVRQVLPTGSEVPGAGLGQRARPLEAARELVLAGLGPEASGYFRERV